MVEARGRGTTALKIVVLGEGKCVSPAPRVAHQPRHAASQLKAKETDRRRLRAAKVGWSSGLTDGK